MEIRVNPTRMELNRLKGRLKMAVRGHKLLKDKRDELMRKFLVLVKRSKKLREEMEIMLSRSFSSFLLARAVMSSRDMEASLMFPKDPLKLEMETVNLMSVNVPKFRLLDFKAGEEGKVIEPPYGFVRTSAEMDITVSLLTEALPHLIELAELEKAVNLLADEIDRTRRRVNALEQIMIPQLEDTIKYISMKLDENERGALTRLMKIKDIVRGEGA